MQFATETFTPRQEVELSDMLKTMKKLTLKDIRQGVSIMDDSEARFLVDLYYRAQDSRIRANNQLRSLKETPNIVLAYLSEQETEIEKTAKKALEAYVNTKPIGRWLLNIYGIGPVIAAGLLAHIDINKAPTAGHIWAYAGYDPTKKWEKGQIRPWNPDLKRISWLAGQSFIKFHNQSECYYGKLYEARITYEKDRNEKGLLADEAKRQLTEKNIRDEKLKATLESGKLSDGHLVARASRWTVKIFLSHLHQIWYELEFGVPAPKPFSMVHLGHAHIIPPDINAVRAFLKQQEELSNNKPRGRTKLNLVK